MAAVRLDKGQVAEKLAGLLRAEVETAQGKIQFATGLEWKDYARGKDMARYLRDKPDLMEELVRPAGPDRGVDDLVSDTITQLVQRKLLVPCDRKFKKPKPGRTKLVKWPRTLDALRDDAFRPELFYAWPHDRPASTLFYVMSALVAAGVILLTLFPLAPHWLRLGVLYLLTTLLCIILGALALRYAVWGAVWVVTGHHLWVLPNITSETVPINEILSPLMTFDREEGPASAAAYAARGVTLLVAVGGALALVRTAPDAKHLKKSVSDAHFTLLEYFDLHNARDALGGANGTFNATAGGGGHPGAAHQRAQQQRAQQQRDADLKQQQKKEQQQRKEETVHVVEEEDDEEDTGGTKQQQGGAGGSSGGGEDKGGEAEL